MNKTSNNIVVRRGLQRVVAGARFILKNLQLSLEKRALLYDFHNNNAIFHKNLS